MANTVIAIFEDHDSALHAERNLLEQGFVKSEIDLKTAHYKQEQTAQEEDEKNPGIIDTLTSFFKDLFADDQQQMSDYAAASKNRTIVTVHAHTDEDAERASSILDHYGAMHVGAKSENITLDGDDPTSERVSGIKSRIVQRSVIKDPSRFKQTDL